MKSHLFLLLVTFKSKTRRFTILDDMTKLSLKLLRNLRPKLKNLELFENKIKMNKIEQNRFY